MYFLGSRKSKQRNKCIFCARRMPIIRNQGTDRRLYASPYTIKSIALKLLLYRHIVSSANNLDKYSDLIVIVFIITTILRGGHDYIINHVSVTTVHDRLNVIYHRWFPSYAVTRIFIDNIWSRTLTPLICSLYVYVWFFFTQTKSSSSHFFRYIRDQVRVCRGSKSVAIS